MLLATRPAALVSWCGLPSISMRLAQREPGPPTPYGTESVKCVPIKPAPSFHSTRFCSKPESTGLIHVSMVRPLPLPTLSEGEPGTRKPASVPLKLKALPTSPPVKLMPPRRLAILFPTALVPLPSPCHHPTKPSAAGAQLRVGITHLPALPALYIAWISSVLRARE